MNENREIVVRETGDNFETLERGLGISTPLAKVLSARGVQSVQDVDLGIGELLSPHGLPGVQAAATRIIQAIEKNERIFVSGDYDVDGATASVLCVTALRAFGAKHVDFVVPNRFQFGYGLSEEFLETILDREPNLIITVDNGITSINAIDRARSEGIDVIVTDHHLPSNELPNATAIVNPKLEGSKFDSEPAGVGVAFYVMIEIRRQLRELGYFEATKISEPNMTEWLDLVAIGTVADMVPLDHNNRILVENGLRRMRRGRLRPGIIALCEVAQRQLDTLSADDIGFALAPRINAAGRLEDISTGIRALLADDIKEARQLCDRLNEINQERRSLQHDNTNVALDSVGDVDQSKCGLCVFNRDFHEGIVGLVASRLVERWYRPTVVFAAAQDSPQELLKGSARSVNGIHIRDVLADIAADNPYLMLSFGGHAMAAGLTIKRSSLTRFAALFDQAVKNRVSDGTFDQVTYSDGELAAQEIDEDLARAIEKYGPWGVGFEAPVFHGDFEIVSQRSVGKDAAHLKLHLKKDGFVFDGIAFGQDRVDADVVTLAFGLELNRYNGNETPQLNIKNIDPAIDPHGHNGRAEA